MNRLRVRDVNLLVPPLLAAVIAGLAIIGWQCSDAIQQARATSIVVSEESRLMNLISANLREAEQAQRDFLHVGAADDLAAYRDASQRIEALSTSLRRRAALDPRGGSMVLGVIRVLDERRAVMAGEVGRRPAPGPGLAPAPSATSQVLQRIGAAGQTLNAHRHANQQSITRGIRTLRWLALTVALLGIVSVLSVFRLLRRAWRRLARAEGEQRQLAQQLRNSLDSLSQGVAVFNGDGQLQTWNMRLAQMLDLPADLLARRLTYDRLADHLAVGGEGFLEALSAIRREALMDPGGSQRRPVVYERAVRQRSGASETQIEIRRTLTPDGGFVLTLTDVTEHARAERMLREAQKMQALGQLTGGIAHDFNNMLTVILGTLDMPTGEPSSPASQVTVLKARMRRAAQAAESGAALIRQLLSFARKQPVAPASVELGSVLPDLVPLLRHSVGELVEISFDAEAGLWPALADPAQLESAVLNLAMNARDAMPKGGRLAIEAGNVASGASAPERHPELEPGDYVRITIADTGCGMDREVIAHAFEPFFTTKPDGRGTGLGLAMVFGFARQSGGMASIDSAPGRGTRVSLFLPRARQAPPSVRPQPLVEPSSQPARAGAPHVLLVEDDASVRDITAEILRGLGYRVSEAADAEQARAAMRTPAAPVDLLLTDIMLPGTEGGRELAASVRRGWPETRVLFMSGHVEGGGVVEAGGDESVQWIGKPFRRAQLADKVQTLLGMRRAGRAA